MRSMKPYNSVCVRTDPKARSCLYVISMSLLCGAYIICSAWLGQEYSFSVSPRLGLGLELNSSQHSVDCQLRLPDVEVNLTAANTPIEKCKDKPCRPTGSEALPRGIVSTTTNLEMRPLTGIVSKHNKSKHRSLLAIAAGIKQKKLVNQILNKFLEDDEFAVMIFHYDGIVNEWDDLEWNNRVIHISAKNQTKWWFAKRFLHPDIVAEYEYIFLWDEDLGVEKFNPGRYVSIIKDEGLEISQPALDLRKSEVHHQITTRQRRLRVHRRYYSDKGRAICNGNSTAPPCVGWVEMMAPVFSRSAWRCVWYMIQNDLIYAWGLDMQLGYCAQGDRTVKVGVVDEEYIVHHGLPTLGDMSKTNMASSGSPNINKRVEIRKRSYDEMRTFKRRWNQAVKEDERWIDPFEQPSNYRKVGK